MGGDTKIVLGTLGSWAGVPSETLDCLARGQRWPIRVNTSKSIAYRQNILSLLSGEVILISGELGNSHVRLPPQNSVIFYVILLERALWVSSGIKDLLVKISG
jgi:hypothetical protein